MSSHIVSYLLDNFFWIWRKRLYSLTLSDASIYIIKLQRYELLCALYLQEQSFSRGPFLHHVHWLWITHRVKLLILNNHRGLCIKENSKQSPLHFHRQGSGTDLWAMAHQEMISLMKTISPLEMTDSLHRNLCQVYIYRVSKQGQSLKCPMNWMFCLNSTLPMWMILPQHHFHTDSTQVRGDNVHLQESSESNSSTNQIFKRWL